MWDFEVFKCMTIKEIETFPVYDSLLKKTKFDIFESSIKANIIRLFLNIVQEIS